METEIVVVAVGGAVALVKVVEKLVDLIVGLVKKRMGREEQTTPMVVTLDPETAAAIRDIHSTVMTRDGDGTPLVFSPRETLKDVAAVLKDVAAIQERMLDRLDRVEDRLDNVLRPQRRQ